MTKRCSRCNKKKEVGEGGKFYRNRSRKDGYDEYCKDCRNSYYMNKRRTDPAYRDLAREAQERYAAKNPEKVREQREKSHKKYLANRTPEKKRQREWSHHLWQNYKITPEEYDQMLMNQDGLCAICEKAMDPKEIHVDHDHNTGRVRGLLCSGCNKGLGFFKESTTSLRNAICYLEEHSQVPC